MIFRTRDGEVSFPLGFLRSDSGARRGPWTQTQQALAACGRGRRVAEAWPFSQVVPETMEEREGEGEDAHIYVEWTDLGSAGAGMSWSGVWGPSPLRTGRSIPGQGLPARGRGLRVEDRGWGAGRDQQGEP